MAPPAWGLREEKEGEEEEEEEEEYSSLSSPRRRLRQWHMQVWFCWFRSYAVSSSLVVRPELLDITDGMDHIYSMCARRRPRQWLMPAVLLVLYLALCFLPFRQAQDALHHGRYGSEVQLCRCCLVDLCLLCGTTGASGLEVQKTASSPQLHFYITVVDISSWLRGSSPWSLRPWRFPSCACIR